MTIAIMQLFSLSLAWTRRPHVVVPHILRLDDYQFGDTGYHRVVKGVLDSAIK